MTISKKSGEYYERIRLTYSGPKIICHIKVKLESISEYRGVIIQATITPLSEIDILNSLLNSAHSSLIGKVKNYSSLQKVKDIK